jgi:CxxC-x17-CxxC domain-containing protein
LTLKRFRLKTRGIFIETLFEQGCALSGRRLDQGRVERGGKPRAPGALIKDESKAASLRFLGETVMPDQEITCAECGSTFTFTEREQEYYTERNLSQPKRCKTCRDARRANFGSSTRGGGGGDRQRYEITCDQCGKTDSVPFKPSTGRPILCGECFSAGRA